jgi:hypothetical protein
VVGCLNSGYTSAAITKRMARIDAMMMMPPETTSRDAHRSRTMRRAVRVRETTNRLARPEHPWIDRHYWIFASSSLAMEAGIGK